MHASSLITLALAATATSVSAASCDLIKLVPLLVDTRNDACQTASGVVFPPPPGTAPTAAQWQKTCDVEACTSLYAELFKATPSECSIGKYAALTDIVNKHRTACGLPIVDGGLKTNSTKVQSSSSSSGSLDRAPVVSQDLITVPPTLFTDEPTTTVPSPSPTPKRNATTEVKALTNSASTLAATASAIVFALATFML